MVKVSVSLRPVVNGINLPTVLKTAILPGDTYETLFIATQVGEVHYVENDRLLPFLDIRSQVLKLGVSNGGYDERGLLGMAFHPEFTYNGLFYVHYSVAGTQGPGALPKPEAASQNGLPEFFAPNPCDPSTLNLKWTDRETRYDHIDTVEEWILQTNGRPQKRRTLLNIRRPFFNHNGVNSLNFSPETGSLVLTTGDGGSGYDPFNLSQNDLEIAGKIIEIDVAKNTYILKPPVVTRFSEIPVPIQKTLTVIAKGVRNIPGISYQRFYNRYIKLVGNVGQDLVESIFSFVHYKPIPVPQLIQSSVMKSHHEGFINLGWRGWEGAFPTAILKRCPENAALEQETIAYYDEAVKTSVLRLMPIVSYFHKDPRPDKFEATALTGVQPYMGSDIPDLSGTIVFTDFAHHHEDNSSSPTRGVLAYTREKADCGLNDFSVIETRYDFGSQSSFYVSLGTNMEQTRMFLGVYGSMNVTNFNQGTVFEIMP